VINRDEPQFVKIDYMEITCTSPQKGRFTSFYWIYWTYLWV